MQGLDGRTFKQCYAGLTTLLAEAAKHDIGAEPLM
jgi:hypothetical protein